MTDLFENPMGLCGFEFVEFAAKEPGILEPVFESVGFVKVANHRSKNACLYRQGDINFITVLVPGNEIEFHAFRRMQVRNRQP